jgi:hypothetical protein
VRLIRERGYLESETRYGISGLMNRWPGFKSRKRDIILALSVPEILTCVTPLIKGSNIVLESYSIEWDFLVSEADESKAFAEEQLFWREVSNTFTSVEPQKCNKVSLEVIENFLTSSTCIWNLEVSTILWPEYWKFVNL